VILIHQRYRQTDGQTDGRHAISIPRYALVHRAVKSTQWDNSSNAQQLHQASLICIHPFAAQCASLSFCCVVIICATITNNTLNYPTTLLYVVVTPALSSCQQCCDVERCTDIENLYIKNKPVMEKSEMDTTTKCVNSYYATYLWRPLSYYICLYANLRHWTKQVDADAGVGNVDDVQSPIQSPDAILKSVV